MTVTIWALWFVSIALAFYGLRLIFPLSWPRKFVAYAVIAVVAAFALGGCSETTTPQTPRQALAVTEVVWAETLNDVTRAVPYMSPEQAHDTLYAIVSFQAVLVQWRLNPDQENWQTRAQTALAAVVSLLGKIRTSDQGHDKCKAYMGRYADCTSLAAAR